MENPIKRHNLSTVVPTVIYMMAFGAVWVFLLHPIWSEVHGYTTDDSYISFRYAENLQRYGKIVWNRSDVQPTEGYTSILWVLICAALKALGANLLGSTKLLGTSLIFATAFLVGVSARIATMRAPLFCGLAASVAFLLNRDLILHMVSGMETALAMLLSTAFFVSVTAINRKLVADAVPKFAFILVGLLGVACAMNRPEFNLAFAVGAGMLVALNWRHRGHIIIWMVLPYFCIGGAYMLWRIEYYGPILPLPFYIKVSSEHIAGLGDVLSFLRSVSPVLVPAIAAMCFPDTRRLLAPMACAVASILIFFIFPAHIMGGAHRFLMPVWGAACFMAAAGVSKFYGLAGRCSWRAAITVLVVIGVWGVYRTGEDPVPGITFYEHGLDSAHIRLGKALHAYGDSHAISMADDGAISYYSGWNVIDSFGLNDRDVALAIAHKRYNTALVLDRNPDLLVLISSSPDEPALVVPHEKLLLDDAQARGYAKIGVVQFAPRYNLFLYAKPSAFTTQIVRDLRREGVFMPVAL